MSSGDARFAELYEAHYRKVHLYCRRRLQPDQVDDAVAETFLAAWRKIDNVPQGKDALLWLYGAARRVLMHEWRGTSRRRRLDSRLSAIGIEAPAPPEELVVVGAESRQVIAAASRLRDADQEVLRLSLWEELSHSEVATVLGINVAAVRQRLSRALKNLTREFNRLDKRRTRAPAAQKGGVQ